MQFYPSTRWWILAAGMAVQARSAALFHSNDKGDILVDMSSPWSLAGSTIEVGAVYFDFSSRMLTNVTSHAQWSVHPFGASVHDGRFIAVISNRYRITAVYASATQTVELVVVPSLDPGDDSDGDGLPNAYELAHGLNPLDAADAGKDNDGDGISNRIEYLAGTDPNVAAFASSASVSGNPLAGYVISNIDRLVWSDARVATNSSDLLGWVGSTRQLIRLWPAFRVSRLHHATGTGPYPETIVLRYSNQVHASSSAGDRLFLSSRNSRLWPPRMALAGSLAISNDIGSRSLDYGTIDVAYENQPCPPHFTFYQGYIAYGSMVDIHHWSPDMSAEFDCDVSLRARYESTYIYHQTYEYADAPPHFLHFLYSLYRVEFASQTNTASFALANTQFVVSNAPVEICGRLLLWNGMPLDQIACRWRIGTDAWQSTGIVLTNDMPCDNTGIPGVTNLFFSFNPGLAAPRLFTLEFFFDINTNATIDEQEERIAASFAVNPVYSSSPPPTAELNGPRLCSPNKTYHYTMQATSMPPDRVTYEWSNPSRESGSNAWYRMPATASKQIQCTARANGESARVSITAAVCNITGVTISNAVVCRFDGTTGTATAIVSPAFPPDGRIEWNRSTNDRVNTCSVGTTGLVAQLISSEPAGEYVYDASLLDSSFVAVAAPITICDIRRFTVHVTNSPGSLSLTDRFSSGQLWKPVPANGLATLQLSIDMVPRNSSAILARTCWEVKAADATIATNFFADGTNAFVDLALGNQRQYVCMAGMDLNRNGALDAAERSMVATVQFFSVSLAVDGNRDGIVSFTDPADRSMRFWLNDDQDSEAEADVMWGDRIEPETIPAHTPDNADNLILFPRDLEDFARLHIGIESSNCLPAMGNVRLGLKWRAIGTNALPAIRIFANASPRGDWDYIRDVDSAAIQSRSIYYLLPLCEGSDLPNTTVASTPHSADFIFGSNYWGSATNRFLIFEGVAEGKAALIPVILDSANNTLFDGNAVTIEIRNIEHYYERAHSMPDDENFAYPYNVPVGTFPAPYLHPANSPDSKAFIVGDSFLTYGSGFDPENGIYRPDKSFMPADDYDQSKCIIFVHGIYMDVPSVKCYAESFYKRLWWEGYRGRFVVFRWSTNDSEHNPTRLPTYVFDCGEFRAWKSGISLRKYIDNLRSRLLPNAAISVAAHSLGNIVVGSALREGMQINSYVMMEAASSISLYYPLPQAPPDPMTNALVAELVAADASSPTPYAADDQGYRGYLANIKPHISGNWCNYYNTNDFWLRIGRFRYDVAECNWVFNERDKKPHTWEYEYHPNKAIVERCFHRYRILGMPLPFTRLVLDENEAMAFISRSRTYPAGGEGQYPAFPGITDSLDLRELYNFGRERKDHSGQFQRNIQQLYTQLDTRIVPFYRRLLSDLNVAPPTEPKEQP